MGGQQTPKRYYLQAHWHVNIPWGSTNLLPIYGQIEREEETLQLFSLDRTLPQLGGSVLGKEIANHLIKLLCKLNGQKSNYSNGMGTEL